MTTRQVSFLFFLAILISAAVPGWLVYQDPRRWYAAIGCGVCLGQAWFVFLVTSLGRFRAAPEKPVRPERRGGEGR